MMKTAEQSHGSCGISRGTVPRWTKTADDESLISHFLPWSSILGNKTFRKMLMLLLYVEFDFRSKRLEANMSLVTCALHPFPGKARPTSRCIHTEGSPIM